MHMKDKNYNHMKKKIAIGNDHAGTMLKLKIFTFLESKGYLMNNCGTDSDQSVDYPDYAHPVAKLVQQQEADLGILICGSAQGVSITANKHNDIRAAVCWNQKIAELARQHNNANVLCLPARFLSIEAAIEIVEVFLVTGFEGGRHQTRIDKINV